MRIRAGRSIGQASRFALHCKERWQIRPRVSVLRDGLRAQWRLAVTPNSGTSAFNADRSANVIGVRGWERSGSESRAICRGIYFVPLFFYGQVEFISNSDERGKRGIAFDD